MYRHKTGIVAERGSLAAACKRIAELSRQAPLSVGPVGAPRASCRSRPLGYAQLPIASEGRLAAVIIPGTAYGKWIQSCISSLLPCRCRGS